jgi:hypothetical protein
MLLSRYEYDRKIEISESNFYETLLNYYLRDQNSAEHLLGNIKKFKNYKSVQDDFNPDKTKLRNYTMDHLKNPKVIEMLKNYSNFYIENGKNFIKYKDPLLSKLNAVGIIFGIRIEVFISSENGNNKVLKFGTNSSETIKFYYGNEKLYMIRMITNKNLISDSKQYGECILKNQVILKTGVNVESFEIMKYPDAPPYYKIDGYVNSLKNYSPISKVEIRLILGIVNKEKVCFYCNKTENLNLCGTCNIYYCTECISHGADQSYLLCYFCNAKISPKKTKGKPVVSKVQPKICLFDLNKQKCEICTNPSNDAVYICVNCGSLGMDDKLLKLCSLCNYFPIYNGSYCILCTAQGLVK